LIESGKSIQKRRHMKVGQVWILSGGRLGDLRLMESVASELGLPFSVKTVEFRKGSNILRSFFPHRMLRKPEQNPFLAETPHIVLTAESPTSALAAAEKQRGKNFILVSLSRPRRNLERFDLIISPPQYPLPSLPNLRRIDVSPHILPPLDDAGRALEKSHRISDLRRPLTAVLVGGTSRPEILDIDAAKGLCAAIKARIECKGGSCIVITSPRTAPEVVDVLAANIPAGSLLLKWQKNVPSHFHGVLAVADDFIVTTDSVSMTVEAMLTGKPVQLYRLPTKFHWSDGLQGKLQDTALVEPLFRSGLLMRYATRPDMFKGLIEKYNLSYFTPDGFAPRRPTLTSTAPVAAAMIREVLERPAAAVTVN